MPAVGEVAILSTCNRTELYCSADLNDQEALLDWLSRYRNVAPSDIREAAYAHWDRDAARHLMRVAAGLDSQVLGEPQILGQVKDACDTAREAGTLGPELNLLSQVTLNVAKQVRTDTDIGRNPVSVAYAAVSLAQQIFADLSQNSALLLGAGDTIELVAQHLRNAGIGSMTIANRTLANARSIWQRTSARARSSSPTYRACSRNTTSSLRRPAVRFRYSAKARSKPRSAAAATGRCSWSTSRCRAISSRKWRNCATSTCIRSTISPRSSRANVSERRRAAESAEEMIVAGTDRYFREKRIRDAQHLLTRFRSRAETLQLLELERARQRLEQWRRRRRSAESVRHEL